MMTSTTGQRRSKRAAAFTLIELILVMLLLLVVISLVTPSLKRFFAGNELDSEARRLVALTRYGQSRAVSQGEPMLLWVDPAAGRYGLESESGYAATNGDPRALEYRVGDGMRINVQQTKNRTVKPLRSGARAGFHFSPDGGTDFSSSVAAVTLQQGNDPGVWIVPTSDGLNYEAQKQTRR